MPRTWSGSPSRKKTTGATDAIGRHEISRAVAKRVAPMASSNPSADVSFTTRSKTQRELSANGSSCITTGAPKDSSAQSQRPRKPLRDRGNIDKAAPACTPSAVSPSTKHRNPSHESRPRLPYRSPGPLTATKERSRAKNTVSDVRQRRFATKSKNDHAASSGTDCGETSEVHTAAGPGSLSKEDKFEVFAKSPRIPRTPPRGSNASRTMLADEVRSARKPGVASARTPKIPHMPPETSCPSEPLATHDNTKGVQELAAFTRSPRIPRTPLKEAYPGELGNKRGDSIMEGDPTAFARSPRIPRTPPEASGPGELVIVKIGSTRRKEVATFARSPRIPRTPPDTSYYGELQSAAGRASITEKGGGSAGSPGPIRTPPRGAHPAGAVCTTAGLSTGEELTAFARTPKIPRTPPIAHRPAQTKNMNGGSSSKGKEDPSAHSRTGDVPRSPPASLAPGVIIDVTGTPVVESGGLATAADLRPGESSKAMATDLLGSVTGLLVTNKLSLVEAEGCPNDESCSLSAKGETDPGPEAAEDVPRAIIDDSTAGTLPGASSAHGTLEYFEQGGQMTPGAKIDLPDAPARPTASCSLETGGETDATGETIDGVEPPTSSGTRASGPKGTEAGRGIESLATLVSRGAADGGSDGDTGAQAGRKTRHGSRGALPARAQDNRPRGEGSEEPACSASPAKESEPPVPRPKSSIPPPAPISTSTRNRLTLEEVRPRICVGRYVSPVPTNPAATGPETRAGERMASGQRVGMSGIERTLTPAAFVDLASEMRTPGTAGVGRAGDSLDKVRSMGSLDGNGWPVAGAKGLTPGTFQQRESQSLLPSVRDGGAQPRRPRPSLPSSSASAAATVAAAARKGGQRASFPREAPRANVPGSRGDREMEDPEVRCTEANASDEGRKEGSVDNAEVSSSAAHGINPEGAEVCTSTGCSLPVAQASGGMRSLRGGFEGQAEVVLAVSAASKAGSGADDVEVLESGGVDTEAKQAGATEGDGAEPTTGSKLKGSSEASFGRNTDSDVSSAGTLTVAGVIPPQGIDAASPVPSLGGVVVNKGTGSREAEEAAGADQVVSVTGREPRASAGKEELNPFARRCELPRTPVGQAQAGSADVVSLGGARASRKEKSDKGDKGEQTELRALREANVQIGELHEEMASMADRLAKQTEERERLAQVALRAQDEVTSLRQVMDGLQRGNPEAAAPSSEARGVQSGSTNTTRVLELELQKWEVEQGRQAAQLEAKETKRELAEARAKVKELAMRDEARQGEWLEEQLRRAQERCAEDEKMMEERRIKAKLLAAEIKAEMMRNRLVEDERERAERNVRVAAVTIARRAANLVEELCSRNKRMARREAGLREGVEEREERVALLTEHSGLLEQAGRAANHEVTSTRKELEETREALTAERVGADGLSTSLEALEREYRNAQRAQDELRVLANVEEARRLSVERQMSEVRRSGETAAGLERARRESTERRLGLAERSRDDLATAAAAAAGPAFRAAAAAERERRVSLERRLDAAERARAELTAVTVSTAEAKAASAVSVAESELRAQVEAERRQRLLLERRLEILESERMELAKAAATAAEAAIKAAENVSAASARVGTTTRFVSPGTKGGEDDAPLSSSSQPTVLARSEDDVPVGRKGVASGVHSDRKIPEETSGSAAAAPSAAPPAASAAVETDDDHDDAGCRKGSATRADGAPDFDGTLESSGSTLPEARGDGMGSTHSDPHLGGGYTRHSKGEVMATGFPGTVRRGDGDDGGLVVPRRLKKRSRSAREPSLKLPRGSSDGQPGEHGEGNEERSACLEKRATFAAAGVALPSSPSSPGFPPAFVEHEDGGRTGPSEPISTESTSASEEQAMCDSGRDGVGTEEVGISAKLNDAALEGGHSDAEKSPSKSVRGKPEAPKLYGRRLAGCSPSSLGDGGDGGNGGLAIGELSAEVEKVSRRKRSARVKRDSGALGGHAESSSSVPQVHGKKPGRRGSAAASRRRVGKVHPGAEEDVAGVSGKPAPPKVAAGNVVGWETLRAVPTRQSRARKEAGGGRSSHSATSAARTSADGRTDSVSPSATEVDSGALLKRKKARTEDGKDILQEESRIILEPISPDEGASKDKGELSPASTGVDAATKKGGRARRARGGGEGGHHAACADGAGTALPEADVSARGSSSSRVSSGRSKRRQTTQSTSDRCDDDECRSGNGSPVLVDSPMVPPPKRSRRLLGVGGARCKTPRAVSKEIAGAGSGSGSLDPVCVNPVDGAIQDAQRESVGRDDGGDSAARVEGSTVVTERVSQETSVQDGVKGPSSPGGSGEVRGTPSGETGGGADGTGGASGGGGGGGADGSRASGTQVEPGVARPAMDATKRQSMASSVLGLRRSKKTKFGMTRESFFQGFLDPKNGFKAPKLKPGAKRS